MSAVASQPLKAPFPAFGGKSQIAEMVWSRLGDVRNFIEPFCFSAATLLLRPHEGKIETVNDLNSYVANFWRAIKHDPQAVAEHADWPVNESDLHSRHAWLVNSDQAHAALHRVKTDPDFFDAKIAGWWCWGACMWIGSGWCETQQLPHMGGGQGVNKLTQQLPHMDAAGRLIHSPPEQLPELSGDNGTGRKVHSLTAYKRPRSHSDQNGYMPGVLNQNPTQKRLQLSIGNSTRGNGVHKHDNPDGHRPQLADAYSRGRGVHGNDELSDCDRRHLWLVDWFTRLSDRLRPVRVCCGHWDRVCDSDSTLSRLGTTGVFLDPPYRKKMADGSESRAAHIYANDKTQDVDALVDEVQAWCLKWDGNPEIRIAVCGLEGEYPKLDEAGWDKVSWKSRGGYGNRTDKGKENAARERVWFNKSCLSGQASDPGLF